MKTIKFRAWEQKSRNGGKMHTMDMLLNPVDYEDLSLLDYILSNPDGYPTFFLMQFTGLKDKAGREIYEGDIVEWPATGERAKVEWWEGDACFEESPTLNGLSHACHQYVVIGNIHETPELLK